MSDAISDLLARIRGAGAASEASVKVPHSQVVEAIAKVLKQEGYLSDISVEGSKSKFLKLDLRYDPRKKRFVNPPAKVLEKLQAWKLHGWKNPGLQDVYVSPGQTTGATREEIQSATLNGQTKSLEEFRGELGWR